MLVHLIKVLLYKSLVWSKEVCNVLMGCTSYSAWSGTRKKFSFLVLVVSSAQQGSIS